MFNKTKIITLLVIALIGLTAKYILFNYPISAGKRVGNLTKLSLKGKIIKTWEGTLNEGYGEKLTTYFSISDSKIADDLYGHEGREVVIYYEEYMVGWPRDTKYDVIRWEPMQHPENKNEGTAKNAEAATSLLSKTLFCSLLGTLRTNDELYQKVKKQVETSNPYLYKQIEECNK
jgi:hypothetical protein